MDSKEIASLVSSIVSSLGIAGAVIWSYIAVVPVFAIVLSTSLAYFFARVNSRDTRKYEVRRVAISEALGPLYGQILKIQESFESNRASLNVSYITSAEDYWEAIRHSHKFFVIEEPLRSNIEEYFGRLNRFNKSEYLAHNDISEVEKVILPSVIPEIIEVVNPAIVTAWSNGERFIATLRGALYWDVDLLSLHRGQFVELYLDALVSGEQHGTTMQRSVRINDAARIDRILAEFWSAARPLLRGNQRFIAEEKERTELIEETKRVRVAIEGEFTKWAKT